MAVPVIALNGTLMTVPRPTITHIYIVEDPRGRHPIVTRSLGAVDAALVDRLRYLSEYDRVNNPDTGGP